jgi:lantibiotic modifying enzyme
LLDGIWSEIFFLFYCSKYKQSQKHYDIAISLLEDSIENINNSVLYYSFSGGLAGIGFSLQLLEEEFIESSFSDSYHSLDNYLYPIMMEQINKGNYDFLHGAMGVGLYFLKRIKNNPDVISYLTALINAMEKNAIAINKDQIAWQSVLDEETNTMGINLGLSHGIPSIIIFLVKCVSEDIEKETSVKLITKTINYMLAQEIREKKSINNYFPCWIEPGNINQQERMAWCYGDLGIGLSIWLAGKKLNNKDWKKKAIEIFKNSATRRDLQTYNIMDACFCHGTSGIAHFYNRIYHYTDYEPFKETALYWYDQTLKMAKYNDGAAGYKRWRIEKYGGPTKEYGVLEGIAGIGLALISAVSDIEPKWDECLLLS